jgi:hypothetical protein
MNHPQSSRLVDKVIASLRGETAKAEDSKGSTLQEQVIKALRIGQPTAEEKQTFRDLLQSTTEASKAKLLYHAPSDTYLKRVSQ